MAALLSGILLSVSTPPASPLSSTSISMISSSCSLSSLSWIPRTNPKTRSRMISESNSASFAHLSAFPRNSWSTRDSPSNPPISTSDEDDKPFLSEEMLREMLGCCKVYISEARNKTALEAIERAVKPFPPAAIVNKFEDSAYGRVGYTLVSTLTHGSSSPLKNAVFAMVKTALDTINLESHCGSHPRLGVVDHICFHPLSLTSIQQVSAVANSLAMDIGSILQVPTYLYGTAREEQCTLDSIRRKLGYFKANREGHEWAGGLELEVVPVKPDAGPQEVSKTKGVVAVGACGWVSNYNVPVMSSDLKAVRRMARKASERGGGLASVQTMALVHGEGVIEVACNLLNPSQVGGDEVQGLIERLGGEEGLLVGKGYYTDYTPDQIVQRYKDLLINS